VIESIIAESDVEIACLQKVRALMVNDRPKRGRPAKNSACFSRPSPVSQEERSHSGGERADSAGPSQTMGGSKKAAKKSSKATP
jgi:hypothetical protein